MIGLSVSLDSASAIGIHEFAFDLQPGEPFQQIRQLTIRTTDPDIVTVVLVRPDPDFKFIRVAHLFDTKDPKDLAKRLALILKAGWKYKTGDEIMRGALFRYANKLRKEEKARPVCRQMAAMLLGRKPRKDEDAEELFFDSLRARDVNGLLAVLFLGVDTRKVSSGLSKKNRAWLRKQDFALEE